MRLIYVVHIAGGALGLLSGYLALFASKGAPLHRRAGVVFVTAMLAMCAGGLLLTLLLGVEPTINAPAAVLTAYLVITAFATVRPQPPGSPWLASGGMVIAAVTGLVMLVFGLQALANGGSRNGMPAFPFFLFAFVGLVGSAGDLRVLRSGRLTGSSRIARHLWRMTFALLIAALSFFLGQAKVIPAPLRSTPLLSLPVLVVLISMLYWLWRVRIRRSVRGLREIRSMETA